MNGEMMKSADEMRPTVLLFTEAATDSQSTMDCLSEGGFRSVMCRHIDEIVNHCRERVPQLVLIDVETSTLDIASLCQTVRNDYSGALVVLADQADEMFQVLGLEMGADDYVIKPISCTLLRARLRAVLRRRETVSCGGDAVITLGNLEVDSGRREVCCSGKQIDLTSKEFDLMWFLARHARTVLSRDQIFEALFGFEYNGVDRSVDIYISRLRTKLGEDSARPQLLKTVRGVGYLLGG